MHKIVFLIALGLLSLLAPTAGAQTLDAGRFRIEWQVVNRFRLFRDEGFFRLHENAWRQYLMHVDGLGLTPDNRDRMIARTSVLGIEHVLNDRYIAFTSFLRQKFDWRGWAARLENPTCYDPETRSHTGCDGLDAYLNPASHDIQLWLSAPGAAMPRGESCEWRIGGKLVATAPCGERVSGPDVVLPYPDGAEISVNVAGEQPIFVDAKVRDLLIASMGDSFASGEGNPNVPVEFGDVRRYRNLYPLRLRTDVDGAAQWTDRLCHRSLYGQHLRAALQIAIEHPHSAVTFLDYTCSGASIEDGILGPQDYVERTVQITGSSKRAAIPVSGDSTDSQLYRLLNEICRQAPVREGDLPVCPDKDFRRTLDFLFLSVGGNDIGFSNVVAWASLRDGVSSSIAEFFGATVSADDFARLMHDVLPDSYAKLAEALETSVPLSTAADGIFDPSRVVLTAYPNLVSNERGGLCEAASAEGEDEDRYPANQSVDMFSSWLTARAGRLAAVRDQVDRLYRRMRELAGDHLWTFAGRSYADRMFEGHGFCAQDLRRIGESSEQLMIPCWGHAERDTQTCQSNWSAKEGSWRPYNPAQENYPYALRQRWVRTFNDAYMVVNQKVTDRSGHTDEKASAAVFSETAGALHPTAEGHAVMADALMLTLRPVIYRMLYENP